jgi:signal transduction histidine kinase
MFSESGLARAALVAGSGLACFAAQWAAAMLWVDEVQISSVWIPGGVMLALAVLTEPRWWPAVLTAAGAGTGLLFLTLDLVRPAGAVLLGLAGAIQTAALAGVLRSVLRRPFALATLPEFLTYLIVVAGGSVVASLLFLAAGGVALGPVAFPVWPAFTLSVLAGYLMVTPVVVLLVRDGHRLRRSGARGRLEAGILGLLLTLAAGTVFTGGLSRSAAWTACAMTIPPLLLWSAMRFGALGASASLLLVTVIATLSINRGLGPFAITSLSRSTLSLQLVILGTGLPLLALAVIVGERNRATAALQPSHLRLRSLTRELIAAREKEATRIARELHDDVGQRLALLSIGLSRLRQAAAQSAGTSQEIVRLQEQTSSIARALRDISHDLYPAALAHVGLSSALQLKCEEVHQATGMDLHLVDQGDTSALPLDISLCLYRVAQEALNNVTRHSGANSANLSLRRQGAELMLQVSDQGRGFTLGSPAQATGLGLHSAAERIGSFGGTLTVESAPGAGTTLSATVPLWRADDV